LFAIFVQGSSEIWILIHIKLPIILRFAHPYFSLHVTLTEMQSTSINYLSE